MAYSNNPSGIPENPTKFDTYFGDKSNVVEVSLLLDSLNAILAAIGGGTAPGTPPDVVDLESVEIDGLATHNPDIQPSQLSVINPAANTGNVLVEVQVSVGGVKNLVVYPGQELNLPREGSLIYKVQSVKNNGASPVYYNAVLIG